VQHLRPFLQVATHFGEHLVALGGRQMQVSCEVGEIDVDRVLCVWHRLAFSSYYLLST
jgi:hypothetical protein